MNNSVKILCPECDEAELVCEVWRTEKVEVALDKVWPDRSYSHWDMGRVEENEVEYDFDDRYNKLRAYCNACNTEFGDEFWKMVFAQAPIPNTRDE